MPFQGIGINEAEACEDCGALVPFDWQNKHMQFHPHEPIADSNGRCMLCHLPEGASVHEPEPTPASVHKLQQQADRERQEFAWLHHCGTLNHGYWHDDAVCGGCRFSVEKASHVDAHYRLVPVEGLSDEGQG
ncbi:hypothetical protein ACIBQX_11470 [Nonomuraea sp. NPDC049714]|uniref:hypothetical protein n=1 Tax=Nonomuraea sp. NPDC049714 TaxID=3364357 RepID=UPI0037BBF179